MRGCVSVPGKRCSMFAGSPETIYRITKAAIAKATGENK
jgi:hypothetical protein